MTDKLRQFFQRKKTNAKFSNAGKGYKLTENTSTASSTSQKETIERVEPTEEAKVAGQAALARLEAKKNDTTKFNISYKAIQARLKRENEQALREAELEREKGQTMDKSKSTIPVDSSILAVAGVYFRCPIISEELLTWDEWKKKIKEFLYEQLQYEEAGLTACLMIQTCNTGKEKIDNCIDTLEKYLDNILNAPNVEKYWKIRMSNKIFQEKVLPIEGSLEFLKAAGFEQQTLMHNDKEENFLVWSPDRCSIDDLVCLLDGLKTAEPIQVELDRNLQVLLPSQANARSELPSCFYTITLEEIKREQMLRTEAIERNQILRTKAMREKEEQRELRKYRFALIRVKFPDSIILQGTFSVHEKFAAVLDFVKENLIDSEIPFVLLTPTREKLNTELSDKTILELKLVPATVLTFSWETDNSDNAPEGYLKSDLLVYIQNV